MNYFLRLQQQIKDTQEISQFTKRSLIEIQALNAGELSHYKKVILENSSYWSLN